VRSTYGPGICALCGKVFQFNAKTVPTIRALGESRPICRACIDLANGRRAERSLPLIQVAPGAYDPEPS
jgi:hypothetical protein